MNRLSDRARGVLARYREAEGMPPSVRDRMLEQLNSRACAGDIPDIDVPPPPASSGLGLGIKIVIGALVLGAGAAVAMGRSDRSAATSPQQPEPVAAAWAADPVGVEVRPEREPRQGAGQTDEVRRAENEAAPESSKADEPRATAVRTRPATARSGSRKAPDDLEAEMKLLKSAQGALRSGDPETALSRLRAHERRFPNGRMEQARKVSKVLALCRLGREGEARSAAKAFLRSHAGSPYAARVRGICVDAEEK